MNASALEPERPSPELLRLADAICEGTLTPRDRDRLEQLLRDSPSMQLAYLAYLDVHAQLHWQGRTGTPADVAIPPDLAALLVRHNGGGDAVDAVSPVRRREPRRIPWATVAAVLVGAAVVTAGILSSPPAPRHLLLPTSPAVSVARLVRTLDVTWTNGGPRYEVGDDLPVGPIRLAGGFAEVQLPGGATLLVEGPAELELLNERSARMKLGKLVVQVPRSAEGILLETPHRRLKDVGTEYGVWVANDGLTTVQVFDGVVETGVAAPSVRRFWPLEAAAVASADDADVSPLPFDEYLFQRPARLPSAMPLTAAEEPLSAEVSPQVGAFLGQLHAAPAAGVLLGNRYRDLPPLGHLSDDERRELADLLIARLEDDRLLPGPQGTLRATAGMRVADRAERALEMLAGAPAMGDGDAASRWSAWRQGVGAISPKEQEAARRAVLRLRLQAWAAGPPYPENLYAAAAVEWAVLHDDRAVAGDLWSCVREEALRTETTPIRLPIVIDAVGRLGNYRLVPDMVAVTREVNERQLVPAAGGYTDDHRRRSETLLALARALDQLSRLPQGDDALRPLSRRPPVVAIESLAFAKWLGAAEELARDEGVLSPSDELPPRR